MFHFYMRQNGSIAHGRIKDMVSLSGSGFLFHGLGVNEGLCVVGGSWVPGVLKLAVLRRWL